MTKGIFMATYRRIIVNFSFLVVFYLLRSCFVSKAQLPSDKPCFCQLSGRIYECPCTIDNVDDFNNRKIYPILQNLLEKNFFRYYKVNMEKECPFWREDRECSSKECGVQNCDDEVPAGLRTPRPNRSDEVYVGQKKNLAESSAPKDSQSCAADDGTVTKNGDDVGNRLDPLDTTISKWQQEQFLIWAQHDDSQLDKYCDVDDQDSATMHYVDLLRNPERYTGYKGNSAQQVWRSIYEENCFKPDPKFDKNFLLHPTPTGLCLEKRVFFRIISGLHTSITVSIASHNYQPPKHSFDQGRWIRNVPMFSARFSAETTNGEGPERLRNLYFVYLMELRALQKIAPYVEDREVFYTGDEKDDEETRSAVQELLGILDGFDEHFDESAMFQYDEARSRQLKEEFRQHFLNISRIMDCVGCDKCRLWGKLQTHGIGTALKILFSDVRPGVRDSATKVQFQLQRNDLVALLQSIGRFASSIYEVAEFRRVLGSGRKMEL